MVKSVNDLVYSVAKKHGVRVYEYANVGNHLHILIKLSHIYRWAAFIRELTGQIAQVVREMLGITELKFWKFRPHTRIVRSWKRAYRIAKEYIELNLLEAMGHVNRKQIPNLKALRSLLQI